MTGRWHPTQAISPDGLRADIKDVANGLQCRCICFECGQPVLAKQGTKRRWYFAHYAPTNCRPTPESELHFFAKTLLAERLWLWIPAVRANAAGRTEPISDRRQYEFSEVRVEKADGNGHDWDWLEQQIAAARKRGEKNPCISIGAGGEIAVSILPSIPGLPVVDDVTQKVLLSSNGSGAEIILVVSWEDLRAGNVPGLS